MNEKIYREEELREELTGKKSTETYGMNYLIEAGAGAGKTYILVNRMINQLLSGVVKPEQIAAITFTEKATQEMVDRIDQELLNRLDRVVKDSGEQSEEAERLRGLIDSIDLMQISTIHSFCRTLLTTMPFESELGPEFEVIDDAVPLADVFFEQIIREHPEVFQKTREVTGIGYDLLKESFRVICEGRAEIIYEQLDEAQLNKKLDDMQALAGNLYSLVRENGAESNIRNRSSKTVEALMPKINEVLRLKNGPHDVFVRTVLDVCNPCTGNRSIEKEAIIRILPGTMKDNRKIVEDNWNPIEACWGEIIHSLSMEVFCELIPEYRRYKRQQKVATQQDLLCCARDMLRDSAEARAYFHQKYSCIYVDEMQDTDPVQAQILFYLTTEEAAYDPDDWRSCRPVPGSLFLVGDPKQAIYRFRGADITVYKTLETLFRNGIGSVEHLNFNYRSSSEITDYSDHMFRELLSGGEYQAAYSKMTAVAGPAQKARIIAYNSGKDSDPEQVAAYIAEMVHNRTTVGAEGKQHEAGYADFLVLTNTNARTEEYVRALSVYGIPCNMSGAKKYAEIPQLIRGNAVLQHLADPDDETKLITALVKCYSIPFTMLRAYRQRTGSFTVNPDAARAALAVIGSEQDYAELFAAMEELRDFRRQAAALPAFTVAENLWQKSRAVWQTEEAEEHVKEYPMVLQFLHELREENVSLQKLAAKSEELLQGTADRELLLTEEPNCVRIMNLHKAKGLEAEVVILAFDSVFRADAEKHVCYEGNREQLHLCMSKANPFGGSTVYAKPAGWDDGPGKEEQEFLRAQIIRLLYVAATRAKTCLIVCTGKKNAWSKLAEKCEAYEECDPIWGRAIAALESGKTDFSSENGEKDEPNDVNPFDLEEELNRKARRLSGARHLDISPSALEQKDELQLSDGGTQKEYSDRIADEAVPHGARWGTIVHRLMELCVRRQVYKEERRMQLAIQAVYETLNGEELSSIERQMLDPKGQYQTDDLFFEGLAREATRQTAFLEQEDHALRKLLDSGKCYTELPFEIHLQKADTLKTLCGPIITAQDELPVELRGVIDLAIRTEHSWILADYKTDARKVGETKDAYTDRLKRQYTPQLRIYKEILNRMNPDTVEAVYLCAISLNGTLIELPL